MILNNRNGTKTFLKSSGNADDPALLLLHGIGADHLMWSEQISFFSGQGFYVLAPDLLGHGTSSLVDTLSLDDWNNQINDLLDELKIGACLIAGTSMGGVIAQYFAAQTPERVKGLILCDTFGELRTLQERILGKSQVLGYKLFRLIGRRALARGMTAAYPEPEAKLARDYFQQAALTANFQQLILARKAINQVDLIGKVPGDRIPTLVLVGDQYGSSFIRINQKIADGIQGAHFSVIPGAKDPSNLVNPNRYNQQVLAFLEGIPQDDEK